MKTSLVITGALLLTIGLVWTGQGANLIGGSFMTGQRTWLEIGLFTALAGAVIPWQGVVGHRRRS